jgi:hypothetical protein
LEGEEPLGTGIGEELADLAVQAAEPTGGQQPEQVGGE